VTRAACLILGGMGALTGGRAVMGILTGLVIAATAVACSGPSQPAHHAAAAAGPGVAGPAKPGSRLTATWTNFGDTAGCVFRYALHWGDGTTQTGRQSGGRPGSSVLARHTYPRPGTYTYRASGRATAGACRFVPADAKFTATLTFTVRGSLPVLPSQSQDTNAQAPAGSVCDPVTFRKDRTEGSATANGFGFLGASSAETLLRHFLAGKTAPVRFAATSGLARDLRHNPQFQALDQAVRARIRDELNHGRRRVTLEPPALQRIVLDEPLDLGLSFGGTQGLTVTGRGRLARRHYTGTLTYTVRDSYGFTTSDHFHGVGDDMRYLQTVCGDPPHQGGAHWFPDSVQLTVHFSLRARSGH
jgi:hypothetical protein